MAWTFYPSSSGFTPQLFFQWWHMAMKYARFDDKVYPTYLSDWRCTSGGISQAYQINASDLSNFCVTVTLFHCYSVVWPSHGSKNKIATIQKSMWKTRRSGFFWWFINETATTSLHLSHNMSLLRSQHKLWKLKDYIFASQLLVDSCKCVDLQKTTAKGPMSKLMTNKQRFELHQSHY